MAAENRNMHMGVESPNKEPSLAGSAAPVSKHKVVDGLYDHVVFKIITFFNIVTT